MFVYFYIVNVRDLQTLTLLTSFITSTRTTCFNRSLFFYFMIVDEGKYYLYRHIRLDKNEPFYIGIGTKNEPKYKNCYSCVYSRAYSKTNRSSFWKKIINKTNYAIEIILESNNYDFIKKKEIEFVSLYGRKDLGAGCLVNMTNGGDGNNRKGLLGKENPAAKSILQYDLNGNFIKLFNSIIEAATYLNMQNPNKIRDCVRLNKNKNYKKDVYRTTENYIWLYYKNEHEQKIEILESNNGSYKRAHTYFQYDLDGNFIKEWIGRDNIVKHFNWNRTTVGGFLKNKTCLGYNYFWFKERLTKEEVLLHKSKINKQVLTRQINKKYN